MIESLNTLKHSCLAVQHHLPELYINNFIIKLLKNCD